MKKSIDDKGELKKIVNELLVSAGEIIMQYRDHVGVVFDKEKNEIVTTADIASNNYLIEQLNIFYPNIEIYSEEGSSKSAAETRWILDPLDGTTPWVAGNSGFSISLALEQKGEVVVGAVYDPVMKELFYAEKNKGGNKKWRCY